ncbi:hypothetical protein AVEN_220623-1 [Araneus ventricosus]|uniref:Uncharacterized protein n=1 Tax=Araneus ventricosus TaxID=182803 RepID=A0A4Y2TYC4_ARAVE|nr:hypothetical protein AVEN_220623-1 [Araneus ventricosus]
MFRPEVQRVQGSKPDSAEARPCMWACRTQIIIKGPSASRQCGAEHWRGGCQLRCRLSHLTAYKMTRPVPNSTLLASKWDINVTKLH